jgi:hypothetical protein
MNAFVMRFIYVRQSSWVHQKVPHWVRASPATFLQFYGRGRAYMCKSRTTPRDGSSA